MTLSARLEADIQVLVAARYLPTLGASLNRCTSPVSSAIVGASTSPTPLTVLSA